MGLCSHVSAQHISKLHFIQQIVNVKIYYVSKFSNILFQIITVVGLSHFPDKNVIHKNVTIYTSIFLSFYLCCLKLPQSKSVPQESVKEDGQQNVLVFMFSQYPFLLFQNIHSVGVYNSFIQEEIKLQFCWYWRK